MAGLGPSSKVRAIFFGDGVWRMVGPYSSDDGATAPHAAVPAHDAELDQLAGPIQRITGINLRMGLACVPESLRQRVTETPENTNRG